METMTRQELIAAGVRMFQKSCFESNCHHTFTGQTCWYGKTCEGGGAYCEDRMNQDTMTPVAVAFEVGHRAAIQAIKQIRAKAEEEANLRTIEIALP